jgi:hypothetical protein
MKYLLLYHGNNGYVNAPQCYVVLHCRSCYLLNEDCQIAKSEVRIFLFWIQTAPLLRSDTWRFVQLPPFRATAASILGTVQQELAAWKKWLYYAEVPTDCHYSAYVASLLELTWSWGLNAPSKCRYPLTNRHGATSHKAWIFKTDHWCENLTPKASIRFLGQQNNKTDTLMAQSTFTDRD